MSVAIDYNGPCTEKLSVEQLSPIPQMNELIKKIMNDVMVAPWSAEFTLDGKADEDIYAFLFFRPQSKIQIYGKLTNGNIGDEILNMCATVRTFPQNAKYPKGQPLRQTFDFTEAQWMVGSDLLVYVHNIQFTDHRDAKVYYHRKMASNVLEFEAINNPPMVDVFNNHYTGTLKLHAKK